ncbi:MAG: TlpA family protein disulfide reductase [Candidatus Rifleibacteriota bacterium]
MNFIKKRKLIFCLLAVFLIALPVMSQEPEELNQEDIRQELMQKEGKVVQFLQEASKKLNQNLQNAFAEGKVDPKDMDAVKGLLAKHTKGVFAQAEKLRKTLKEPEERLKLDLEMISLAAQSGMMDQVIKMINKWKGDVREIMILTSAQRLKLMKENFSPEFDALIKELKSSKNPEIVAAGEKMLNEFFRDPVGKKFPEFPEGLKTTDGKELSLDRFKDKILLVDFWATWCPPCVEEVPNLVKTYNKYHEKGFEIIGISFDESKEKFDKYIEENNMPWPQYFDGKGWKNEVGPTYGIQSIPTMYLLDKDQKVISNNLRGENLEKELEKIFK